MTRKSDVRVLYTTPLRVVDADDHLLATFLRYYTHPPPLHFMQLLETLGVGVDQYELEWCGAGARLDIPRSETWQLFVKETAQSPSSDHEKPFGYLR